MRYPVLLLDVDGTLVNSEAALYASLDDTMKELGLPAPTPEIRELAMHGTSEQVFERAGARDPETAVRVWNRLYSQIPTQLYPGIRDALDALHGMGCRLGLVTSRTHTECAMDPTLAPLLTLMEIQVCVEDTSEHKPSPRPILYAAERLRVSPREILYVGDSPTDAQSAAAAGVDFALARWGCRPGTTVDAQFDLVRADDLVAAVRGDDTRWLDWARELQFLAQAGLAYSKDPFDLERFARIREIAAEILQAGTGMDLHRITDLFCNETGFQTPKLDTRAAIFDGDRILLVQERDGRWALPGGWVDVDQSIAKNALKEVREEAGLEAEFVKLIALHDHNRHNRPVNAYGICSAFVLCRALGGEFHSNIETLQTGYFPLDALPPLAESKTTAEQIRMCFDARSEHWNPPID